MTTEKKLGLETEVQFIKGVGPRLGGVLSSRGIDTVKDVLQFFPRSYEDRTKVRKLSDIPALEPGDKATFRLKIISSSRVTLRGRGRGKTLFTVRAADETGHIQLKWFYMYRGMDQQYKEGREIIVTGTPKAFMGRVEMVHPDVSFDLDSQEAGNSLHSGRIIPVYTQIDGVSTKIWRKVLWSAIEKFAGDVEEDIPTKFTQKHTLPQLARAIREIHFPTKESPIEDIVEFRTHAHSRLIYEEFFKFEYLVLKQRMHAIREAATAIGVAEGKKTLEALESALPFQLTKDQQKAVADILEDLRDPHPMNRLVQGDVGSGKTAVAMLTAGVAIAEGGQVALMAPTEILAEQHFRNAQKLFGDRLPVRLLTGKSTTQERDAIQTDLSEGRPLLLIGTHALIEDRVQFKNLVYIMIDEQHRFGVEQRRKLRDKGPEGIKPHFLVLTATPIPRTLALTAYGDLAVSSIRELPPGRMPIKTQVIHPQDFGQAYLQIRKELQQGRQAYFIFPLVDQSEAEGFENLKSAIHEAERLKNEVFPEYTVGLLHGKMKPNEKAEIMERFRSGEIQILVSTTVVEVGVDVPNATVMAIEHSERFGLSQLHQLRGRVGRGSHESFCFLFTQSRNSEDTSRRLAVLEKSSDGFEIAEADLEIRGPGEFLGTRQSGGLPFRIANLIRDRDWLFKAREDAMELLKEDPELSSSENRALRRFFEREGSLQFERLQTS